MIQDEYKFLLEKFIDKDITEKQLTRLERTCLSESRFQKGI